MRLVGVLLSKCVWQAGACCYIVAWPKVKVTLSDNHYSLQKTDLSTNRIKWEAELSYEFEENTWKEMYKKVMKLTLSTKLRFFQYRIINRHLFTNVRLVKWDTKVSHLCTFCQNSPETILHIFVHCKVVIKFWGLLFKWLYHFCFIPIKIEPQAIIFNNYKTAFSDLINSIVLITKHYIYVQRCLGKELKFIELIQKISFYKKIEHLAARGTKKLEKVKYK